MTTDSRGTPRRPSLKDVAERAGVSFQTASKVLRGGGSVTNATRARIHAAAAALGYVPNDIARSLVTRRTRTIGIVAGDLGDGVLARFIVGAEREARRLGHAVLVVSVEPGSDAGERSLRSLLERRVDGVVTAAPQLEEDERLGELLRTQVPTVSIHSIAGGGVSLVGSDQREVGALATTHLIDHGHRRIAMVTGPMSRHASRSRASGYERALASHGITRDPALRSDGDWRPQGGYDAAVSILRQVPDVSAMYVHNDLMAVGVLHAAHALGRSVPDELAVVGCDDIPIAGHTVPALSTVRLPFTDTGVAAVRTLVEQLDQPPEQATLELMPVDLVRRASCGCGEGRVGDAAAAATTTTTAAIATGA